MTTKILISIILAQACLIQAFGELGNYTKAAVSSDSRECASIGREVMERNGNAVDAAVAAMFCDGLTQSSSMGIGGGLFMTIYLRETQEVVSVIARERAPLAASEDMFVDDPSLSRRGPLSIAVPGQVMGLWEAKDRYGNPEVTWASLIQPSIDLAKYGIPVTDAVASDLEYSKERIKNDPGMREIFINPETDDVWKYNDTFTWPNLAETLEKIAFGGVKEFYSGETAQLMIEDLESYGAIITEDDFFTYQTSWDAPTMVKLRNGLNAYSTPPPGSGAINGFILNVMDNYDLTEDDLNDEALLIHRITESFKWAYGQRSRLGDPFDANITQEVNELVEKLTSEDFAMETYLSINDSYTVNNASYYGADFSLTEDHGTTHLSVFGPNGDAVSVTSTINTGFGSGFMSPRTGVIFNNEMDDFSSPNITNIYGVPPSPHNFIRPGKRPLSSMCPTVVVDSETGDVVLITGASGGTRITTESALVALRNLWLGLGIKEATDSTRFHHQLAPMNLRYNEGLSEDVIASLEERGHNVTISTAHAAVMSIRKGDDGRIYANADYRKEGWVDGF